VDDCEILHQLKTVVNIPLFCWGFNHPRWWCRISQPSTVVIGVICYIPTYYPSIQRKSHPNMVYTTGVRSKNMNHQRCQKTGAKKTINGICSGGCRIENAVHNEPIVNGDVILLGLSLLSWERGRGIVQPSDFGAKSKDTEQRYPQ
jgi:hypothetical protein